jgi:hypothetical protein
MPDRVRMVLNKELVSNDMVLESDSSIYCLRNVRTHRTPSRVPAFGWLLRGNISFRMAFSVTCAPLATRTSVNP